MPRRLCARLWPRLLLGRGGWSGTRSSVLISRGQSLDGEILRGGQEGVEVVLGYADLTVVHEVEDGDQLGVLDPLQVEQRPLVPVHLEHPPEEGRAGGQDDLVRPHLPVVLRGQGHVEEVRVLPQLGEGRGDVGLEVVPPQAELVRRTHPGRLPWRRWSN